MDVCLSVDGIWRMYWKIMGGERVHVCVSQERKNNTYHTKFRFVTLLHIQTYVRRLWWLLYKFSHAEHTISRRPVPASLSLSLSLHYVSLFLSYFVSFYISYFCCFDTVHFTVFISIQFHSFHSLRLCSFLYYTAFYNKLYSCIVIL